MASACFLRWRQLEGTEWPSRHCARARFAATDLAKADVVVVHRVLICRPELVREVEVGKRARPVGDANARQLRACGEARQGSMHAERRRQRWRRQCGAPRCEVEGTGWGVGGCTMSARIWPSNTQESSAQPCRLAELAFHHRTAAGSDRLTPQYGIKFSATNSLCAQQLRGHDCARRLAGPMGCGGGEAPASVCMRPGRLERPETCTAARG